MPLRNLRWTDVSLSPVARGTYLIAGHGSAIVPSGTNTVSLAYPMAGILCSVIPRAMKCPS